MPETVKARASKMADYKKLSRLKMLPMQHLKKGGNSKVGRGDGFARFLASLFGSDIDDDIGPLAVTSPWRLVNAPVAQLITQH